MKIYLYKFLTGETRYIKMACQMQVIMPYVEYIILSPLTLRRRNEVYKIVLHNNSVYCHKLNKRKENLKDLHSKLKRRRNSSKLPLKGYVLLFEVSTVYDYLFQVYFGVFFLRHFRLLCQILKDIPKFLRSLPQVFA